MRYEIGNKIRYFRENRGLNQKELANRIGVSNSRVSNWEQGINRPDADTLVLICNVLQVSADELLDIRISELELTDKERHVVINYRAKPEMQPAVDKILGLEEAESSSPVTPIKIVAKGDGLKTILRKKTDTE